MQDDDFNPCHIEAHDIFHDVSDHLLQMAASGEIDLNTIARMEFRARLRHKAEQHIAVMARGAP